MMCTEQKGRDVFLVIQLLNRIGCTHKKKCDVYFLSLFYLFRQEETGRLQNLEGC